MKEKNINFAGSVIIFFILLFVFTKWGPAINFATTSQIKGEPFMVTGEGKVYVTPDIAKITVGVQESGVSLKAVQDSVNKKSSQLADTIKKLGVKAEDIKTTSYNLYPEYDYRATVRRVTGYQVSTTYEVTIRDFDKINDIIVAATNAGANMEGSINFDINDSTKKDKLQEARKLAVDEAKAKATGLASSAGITLGKIINISENQNSNRPLPLYMTGKGVSQDVEISPPTIEAGQTEIEVTVSLSYEVR